MRPLRRFILVGSILALAAVVQSCGGDDSGNPVNPPGGGADVTINIVSDSGSNAYSPSPATVQVGQTVSWRNTRTVTHTATANGGSFGTGDIAPGGTSAPIPMSTAGSFSYSCDHHPMSGVLVVQ